MCVKLAKVKPLAAVVAGCPGEVSPKQEADTMNIVKVFSYNDHIIGASGDGYLNLTQMCDANGKRVNDFLRLKQTEEYISELSTVTGIPVTALYQVIQGGNDREQGTWGHPLLSLRCAQWISARFAVWCDQNIFALATGAYQDDSLKKQINGLAKINLMLAAHNEKLSDIKQALIQARSPHPIHMICYNGKIYAEFQMYDPLKKAVVGDLTSEDIANLYRIAIDTIPEAK